MSAGMIVWSELPSFQLEGKKKKKEIYKKNDSLVFIVYYRTTLDGWNPGGCH